MRTPYRDSHISATDGDGDTLTYRLSGADADSFAVDPSTGQIKTKGTYNFEQKDRYSIIIHASDGEVGEASLAVGIAINDIDEPPEQPAPPRVSAIAPTTLTVIWAEPSNTGPEITDYDVQYRQANSDAFIDADYDGTGRTVRLTGLLSSTLYEIQVRAHNEEGTSVWSESGEWTTSAPSLPPGGGGGGGSGSGGGGGGGSGGSGSGGGSGGTPPPGPNQAPTFNDSPHTTRTVAENTRPNQNIQHPVSATDDDGDRLTYRLSGDDADSFTIISSSGQLRTRSGVTYDHEAVKNSYEVTITADDNRGGDATIDVTVYVGDVNEPSRAPARPQVEPASSTSLTVTWTEPTNTGPDIYDYDIQYRKGSDSFMPWPQNNTGTTSTITDLDVNTRYEVQVKAHNDEGESLWSSSGFGTTSANQRPVFDETAPTRILVENTTGTRNIGNPIRATDPEGRTVSYRLAGGDVDQFTIDTNNGQLRTQTGGDYNYEVRNRYSVTVEAADDQGGRTTTTVTINITDDENERPERPDQPAVTASTLNSLSIRWTAPTNTGPNINDYDVQYREGTSGNFTAWPHTGPGTSTTITGLEANTLYQVQVLARSDEGESLWSPSADVRTVANQAPTFNEGTRTTRSFAENTTGTHDIGNTIAATDRDGGTLTYRLEGTDQASFTIDDNQLQTRASETYNYEEKNSYEVIVRVEDGQGGSNTIEVTINLNDEQEPPETPTRPSVVPASSTSLTVTWTEPTNTGPDIDDYDVQYREGDSGGFTSWSHNSADRTATITGRTPGTSYQAQVRAHNAEGWSDWSSSGTGSTSANQRPVFTDGSSATRSLDENTTGVQNIGDPISATDPEDTTLTYSLEGQDKDAFTLISNSGQLRTNSGETYNYETKSSYSVMVKATDGHSGDRTIPVFIHLNDVNEAPTFTSDDAFEVAENVQFVGTVIADDEDSADRITDYTITGGADQNQFEINSAGALTFKDAPDFENPTDSGRNNQYIVVVTATGGTGGRALTADQTITVTVTDENEPPTFTSDDAFNVKENVQSVGRVTAEDVDSGDGITGYEVTGSADQNMFEMINTNELRFKDDPDFERPADGGGNNEYSIVVTATGGTDTRMRTTMQAITVTVEDVDEPPGKPDLPTVSNETENSLTVSWDEPTNTGPDITNYHVRYREGNSGTFTNWPDTGPSRTRTITGLRSGTTYQIQVQAENAEGKSAWSNTVNGTTLTAPTVSRVAFTSTPASGQNSTYKLNAVMDITATFSEAVTVSGTPQINLTVGSIQRKANYQSGSTTTQLLFQYTVQATDEDTDGATINANGLKLNGGRIRKNNTTINADLTHAARTNQSGHKVDGVAPALTNAEVRGDALTLTYSEVLDSSSKPVSGDFAVTVNSEARNVSTVAMSSSEMTLTLASPVAPDQTVTLTYTPGTNPIRDQVQNPAIALANQSVTNMTGGICGRTAQVRDAIIALAPVSNCNDVTEDHLAAISELRLGGKRISALKSGDFSGLTALTTLDLYGNDFETLPADLFSGLTTLEKLYLYTNDFETLPAGLFSGLSSLETLHLRHNQLSSLPTGLFSGLTTLTTLNLNINSLETLPADLFSGLTALTTLSLDNNNIETLPADLFSGLTALTTLILYNNNIETLSADLFSGLIVLRTLELTDNDIEMLPVGVFSGLTALTTLSLDNNNIETLPADLFSGLTALTTLNLYNNNIETLPTGVFSGLTALTTLILANNDIEMLPVGVFSGLTALTTLSLRGNSVSPLPISVSLEPTGTDQFKATAHTGAPFAMDLPVRVANGYITSGAQTIAILAGSTESGPLAVSRPPGTGVAVTADIKRFPPLPSGHSGYALVKSADLPLDVIAVQPVTIYPTSLSMPENGSNTYSVVLNALPTGNVTVGVTVPSGSNVSANPSQLTFTTSNYNESQTITVTASMDENTVDDMVTLSHTVSGSGDYQGATADDVHVTVLEMPGDTNAAPTFTSDSTFEVEENETIVGTVIATDADNRDYITGYAITGGDDQAQFSIGQWGR